MGGVTMTKDKLISAMIWLMWDTIDKLNEEK